MINRPLNFANAKEREEWITNHADYYTTVRMIQRKYDRQEHKTLKDARTHAHLLLAKDKSKPVLIYAIHDNSDTYVEMVKP
jgi:hypothetical protein